MTGFFYFALGKQQLLAVCRELKGGVMFLFEPVAKGKNREPGLQENFVRNFTGRQPPPGVFLFTRAF